MVIYEGEGFPESLENPISIVDLLEKLGLSGNQWIDEKEGSVRGKSGLYHSFDIVLTSRRNPDSRIVCIILDGNSSSRSTKMSTFYVHSVDISAQRMIVLSTEPSTLEERMLSSSLGIEMYRVDLGGQRESRGRGSAKQNLDLPEPAPQDHRSNDEDENGRKSRKKYRDRTQIIHEILDSTSTEEGATITRIIFRCNLNYNSARKIIQDMLRKELLSMRRDRDNKKVYRITSIGSDLLDKLHFYDAVNSNRVQ